MRYIQDLLYDFETMTFDEIQECLTGVRVLSLQDMPGTITRVVNDRHTSLYIEWDNGKISYPFLLWEIGEAPHIRVIEEEDNDD